MTCAQLNIFKKQIYSLTISTIESFVLLELTEIQTNNY